MNTRIAYSGKSATWIAAARGLIICAVFLGAPSCSVENRVPEEDTISIEQTTTTVSNADCSLTTYTPFLRFSSGRWSAVSESYLVCNTTTSINALQTSLGGDVNSWSGAVGTSGKVITVIRDCASTSSNQTWIAWGYAQFYRNWIKIELKPSNQSASLPCTKF